MSTLPLKDVRVLDLGMYWAGPMAGRLLADFGAEVIKIESLGYMDPWRGRLLRNPPEGARNRYPKGVSLERPYNLSAGFNLQNRNKFGITLGLDTPQGKELFKRLVEISDVVLENYSPRVMGDLGLDYPVLQEINPRIIMVSLPALGRSGPWKDYIAYGSTIDCMSGMAYVTGYPGEEPMVQSGMAYGDPLSGMNSAFAIVSALHHRHKSGTGMHIELSQVEALVGFNANTFMDYTMNGRLPERIGNRDPLIAPQGCYRCKGEDRWVVIAIESDELWKKFSRVIGQPALAEDSRFANVLVRYHHQDELDKLIEAWTIEQDHYEVMHMLQGAGIAAGAVLDAQELVEEPHLRARGFYKTVTHREAGTHPYIGMYAKFSKTPGSIRKAAPTLGEDNRYVFGGLLGLSSEDMAQLEQQGIIGTTPSPKQHGDGS